MKRSLGLVFGLFLLVNTAAHAGVGLHGGLNFANQSTSAVIASPNSTEVLLGAFYESAGDVLHFQPEFNYVKKGIASYLTVPLLLKLKIEAPLFRPFLVVGPAVGIKADGPLANSFDFSLDAGVGAEYEMLPKFAILAEVRYSLGLVNVSTSGATVNTRGLYAMLGVHFLLN